MVPEVVNGKLTTRFYLVEEAIMIPLFEDSRDRWSGCSDSRQYLDTQSSPLLKAQYLACFPFSSFHQN